MYNDAEALAEDGLVHISTGASHGYSQYSATGEGIEESHRLCERLPEAMVAHGRVIVSWVRQQSFRGLVSAIYEKYPNYRVNSVFTR